MKHVTLTLIGLLVITACSSTPSPQPTANNTVDSSTDGFWFCQGTHNRQWQCSKTNGAGLAQLRNNPPPPQPLVKAGTTTPTHKEPPTAHNIVTAVIPTPKAPATHAYAVQLLAARSQQTLDHFSTQYPQLTVQATEETRQGDLWHVVLLGVYPDYSSASKAVAKLPPSLTSTAWIRPWKTDSRTTTK